ncbi:MAG: diacylglycerol kinase family protein [Planctomycetes bacterium]|nr:diacylglycerol kinase family protein [Planctomycetota bacterium]
MTKPSLLVRQLRSFGFAFRGIGTLLRTQTNARWHLVATLGVVTLGLCLGLSRMEWCVLVLAMTAVWTAEALNTALEFLADVASPELHPLVEKAKDVAAAGVLIAALGAVVLGVLVLWPHRASLLG